MDTDDGTGNSIVDSERKTLRKKAIIPEVPWVDARMKAKRVNVREQGIEEVIAQPLALRLVKAKSVD
jgi:hypothetical protein